MKKKIINEKQLKYQNQKKKHILSAGKLIKCVNRVNRASTSNL
jgi:hypothetical protein